MYANLVKCDTTMLWGRSSTKSNAISYVFCLQIIVIDVLFIIYFKQIKHRYNECCPFLAPMSLWSVRIFDINSVLGQQFLEINTFSAVSNPTHDNNMTTCKVLILAHFSRNNRRKFFSYRRTQFFNAVVLCVRKRVIMRFELGLCVSWSNHKLVRYK